jgi:hypothetical protein
MTQDPSSRFFHHGTCHPRFLGEPWFGGANHALLWSTCICSPPVGESTAVDAFYRSEGRDCEEKCSSSTSDVIRRRWTGMVMNLSVASSSRNACSNACYAKTLFLSFPVSNYQKTRKVKANPYEVSEKADIPHGS